MHQVAREHGVVLAVAESEGGMARRVSRRRQDAGVVADNVVVADDFGLPGLDDRQHAVAKRRHGSFCVRLGPVVELGLAEHVARLGKGRHPAAIVKPRVPADMIDMQMRAHDIVDIAHGEACCSEAADIGIVGLHVPFRSLRPRLVVADAAIDQDGVVRRLHDIGLETQDQHVVGVERTGLLHPLAVLRQ